MSTKNPGKSTIAAKLLEKNNKKSKEPGEIINQNEEMIQQIAANNPIERSQQFKEAVKKAMMDENESDDDSSDNELELEILDDDEDDDNDAEFVPPKPKTRKVAVTKKATTKKAKKAGKSSKARASSVASTASSSSEQETKVTKPKIDKSGIIDLCPTAKKKNKTKATRYHIGGGIMVNSIGYPSGATYIEIRAYKVDASGKVTNDKVGGRGIAVPIEYLEHLREALSHFS